MNFEVRQTETTRMQRIASAVITAVAAVSMVVVTKFIESNGDFVDSIGVVNIFLS